MSFYSSSRTDSLLVLPARSVESVQIFPRVFVNAFSILWELIIPKVVV